MIEGFTESLADINYQSERQSESVLGGFGHVVENLVYQRESERGASLDSYTEELSNLSSERNSQTSSVLNTVTDLATVVQINVKSLKITANKQMAVVVGAMVIGAVVVSRGKKVKEFALSVAVVVAAAIIVE